MTGLEFNPKNFQNLKSSQLTFVPGVFKTDASRSRHRSLPLELTDEVWEGSQTKSVQSLESSSTHPSTLISLFPWPANANPLLQVRALQHATAALRSSSAAAQDGDAGGRDGHRRRHQGLSPAPLPKSTPPSRNLSVLCPNLETRDPKPETLSSAAF